MLPHATTICVLMLHAAIYVSANSILLLGVLMLHTAICVSVYRHA
jgi:hypothetical protein